MAIKDIKFLCYCSCYRATKNKLLTSSSQILLTIVNFCFDKLADDLPAPLSTGK